MQVFKRLTLLNYRDPKVIGIASIIALLVMAFLVAPSVNAAGETYSYAESGAKIVGKGGSFGNTNTTFTKSPVQTGGKDTYTGSVKVKGNNGDCALGISIAVSTGGSSGVISAPGFLNGLPSAGAAGANYTPSCDRSFAASFADFNKSISVSTASTNTPAPVTETAGQKEVIATIYSDKKVSTLPSVKVALAKSTSPGTATSNTVDWNASSNIGSTRWSNIEPGTYRICVTPSNLFSYFSACQDITKVAGTAAQVNFGSSANSLNEQGKLVTVNVNLSIPGGTGVQTYGPIGLTLINSTTQAPVGPTADTNSQSLGDDETAVRNEGQTIILQAKLDPVEPGTYVVCVTGNSNLCSPAFTKEVNQAAKTEINISEEQSKTFLATAGQSTCAVEQVGWIVCPVISFTATIADSAFSFLSDNFLTVNIGVVATDSATYQVWVIMRNIANLAFVIAFLFIIFSQLTGQGIANYGIKKLLPRIVIAAILVNLSFYICQLAVDLSNVLGYSINQAFKSIGAGISLPNGAVSTDESTNWVGIAAAVLAGGAIAWSLGISVLLPFLLGAVIALVMVFVILVLRQMLIILLVIIAPIAFVAFLLPNTEQWFAKWRKMFTSLLLVFPMIGLLFGAASVASVTLKAATYSTGDAGGVIGKIVAAGIIALPLFMLPSLLKGSLNSVGNIGAKLNGMSSKLSKGGRSKLAGSGVMKSLAHQKQTRRAQIGAGIYDGKNPLSKIRSGVNGRLNRNKAYNIATGNYGTIRGANIEKLENEETKLAEAAIQLRARGGESVKDQFEAATASGDVVAAKAAQNILMKSGSTGVSSVREVIQKNEGILSDSMRAGLASNISENHGQVAKQKAPDLLKWSTNPYDDNKNKMNMEQISAAAKTWGGLSARELADLPDGSFASAMSSGGVSTSTLDALKSDRMRENLSDGQRAAMLKYRDPSSVPPATSTNNGSAGATTVGGTSTSGRAPTRSTPQSENNFLTTSTAPTGAADPGYSGASTTSVDVPLGTARVETRQQPTEVIVNPSATATSEGLYRINSAGKPIRPKNSSKKNDGALIGAQQAAVIDANAGLIRSMAGAQAAAAAAQKASLNRGETFDQAKAAADEAYRKNSGA